MSSPADALNALRDAIKAGNTITPTANDTPTSSLLSATHISLSPTLSLPKTAPTRWRKAGVSTVSSPSDCFTLEAVYLAWLLKDASGVDYMKQARENGLTVGFITITEKKSVVDWLEGRIETHDRIQPLCKFII
jgi:parafibromin